MQIRFQKLLTPPTFNDNNLTRTAGLLHIILLTLFAVLGFLALITGHPRTVLITAGMSGLSLGLWLIMRRGYLLLASWGLMGILVVGITAIIYFNGTIRIPAASSFIACILVAGLTLGNRAMIGSAITISAILFMLYRAEAAGKLPPIFSQSTSFLQWATYCGILCITAVLLMLANRNIQSALALARKHARSLSERNYELQAEITERQQIEQALRASDIALRTSEQKFVMAFQTNPSLIAISRLENGIYIEVNETFLEKLGYQREEVIGKSASALNLWVHPEHRQAIIEQMQQDGFAHNIEIQVRTKDQRMLTLAFSAEYLAIEDEILLLTIGHDITERKQAELALSRYAERLTILRQIDQAILRAQSPEEIAQAALEYIQQLIPCLRVSVMEFHIPNGLANILACRPEGPTNLPAKSKYPLSFVAPLVELLRSGQPNLVIDIQQPPFAMKMNDLLKAEGVAAYINLPILVQDELIGSLNIGSETPNAFTYEHIEMAQDIANLLAIAIQQANLYQQVQQHAQKLEEHVAERTAQLATTNQELESFSYSVAHDLRTPLRAVDGFSRMLLEDCGERIGEQGHFYIDRIITANKRMSQLIDDLLSLSRLTRSELTRETVNLSQMAQTIIDELRQHEPERQIEWIIAGDLSVEADSHLMHVVLENILGNAWKFTAKISQAVIEFNKFPGKKSAFFVSDNGAGFDMTYANKLFNPFQRLHTEGEFPGTGIGLAIVKRVIHRHGGEVWATGNVNRGAVFYFTIG